MVTSRNSLGFSRVWWSQVLGGFLLLELLFLFQILVELVILSEDSVPDAEKRGVIADIV
jgi:hypothetical protein